MSPAKPYKTSDVIKVQIALFFYSNAVTWNFAFIAVVYAFILLFAYRLAPGDPRVLNTVALVALIPILFVYLSSFLFSIWKTFAAMKGPRLEISANQNFLLIDGKELDPSEITGRFFSDFLFVIVDRKQYFIMTNEMPPEQLKALRAKLSPLHLPFREAKALKWMTIGYSIFLAVYYFFF